MRYLSMLIVLLLNSLIFGSELWTVEGRTDQIKDPARKIGKLLDDLGLFLQKPDRLDDEQQEYLTEMAFFFKEAPIADFDVARTGKTYARIQAVVPHQTNHPWSIMYSVMGYRWLDALRETGDQQIRRKLILDLFVDPRHPFISFSMAGVHCDALKGPTDQAARELIWRALRNIPTESKALIPRYQQEHPEDQAAYAAAEVELRVYLNVMQLAIAAFNADSALGPKTDTEWLVIVDNPLLDLMAVVLVTGTDSPLLKRQIDRLAVGGLEKSPDLASWLANHLERGESLTIGEIGPSEAVSYIERLVEMNDQPDHTTALVIAIDGMLLGWYRGWDQPEIWARVLPVRERLLKLVDWSIAHDPAGQYSRLARRVRERLVAKP